MKVAAAVLALGLGGCSSLYDVAGGTDEGPQVLGGVRTWPEIVVDTFDIRRNSHSELEYLCVYFFEGLVDLPCSLVGDVLLLPITLPFEIFRN